MPDDGPLNWLVQGFLYQGWRILIVHKEGNKNDVRKVSLSMLEKDKEGKWLVLYQSCIQEIVPLLAFHLAEKKWECCGHTDQELAEFALHWPKCCPSIHAYMEEDIVLEAMNRHCNPVDPCVGVHIRPFEKIVRTTQGMPGCCCFPWRSRNDRDECGFFSRTCQNYRISKLGYFWATCYKEDRAYTKHWFIVLNEYVENVNGELKPGGSEFSRTCSQLRIIRFHTESSDLNRVGIGGYCKDFHGTPTWSQLDVDSHVKNVDGYLKWCGPWTW
ncbi:hypothetical protein SELMODRAFT_429424 [Selaginella moellendorffii]|uniref:Cyanovirin-N domain-containing protein n=1 Tax=Selaginella moellendorffii TaxID=88036 RepID=D8T646_SELML|nr:hypothetical protein SELMODRAFT_429424 [Selaginella moellendorffii]